MAWYLANRIKHVLCTYLCPLMNHKSASYKAHCMKYRNGTAYLDYKILIALFLIIISIYLRKMVSTCYDPSNAIVYTTWSQLFYCISPYTWAYMGIAIAFGLSIIGAAW